MNTKIGLLLGILGVQLLLVAVAFLASGGDEGAETFLDLDADSVTGLAISGSDDDGVVLTRTGDRWKVGDLPADAGKITEVIGKLTDGAASWPVATSADSQERFEVTATKHQRRVQLLGEGGTLASVYLGTSPGYRRVHARRDGEDEIYSIDFAVHELPLDAGDWLDRKLLASSGIRRVELPRGQVLEAAGEDAGWTLDGAATDPDATRRFLERFERLSVVGLYEPGEGASESEGDSEGGASVLGEARTVVVSTTDGSQRLTFRFNEPGDEYVVTSDRFPEEFTVASFVAEQILGDPDDLLPKAEAEAAADAAAGSGNGSDPTAEAPPG